MATRPPTYDRLISGKKPHFSKVPFCLDPELKQEFQELQKKERDAYIRAAANPDDTRLQSEYSKAKALVAELLPRVEEETVVFKIKSIGRNKYESLLLEHPPTQEQVDRAKKYSALHGQEEKGQEQETLLWNPDTYPVSLIAACLVEPKLSHDEVQKLWNSDEWSGTDLMTLFMHCQAVNARGSQVDLGKG